MGRRLAPSSLILAVLITAQVARLEAQSGPLALGVGPADQGWPLRVQVGPLLEDRALRGALDSALPLRFHLRAELWRKSTLDRLVMAEEISVAIVQDPLDGAYTIESPGSEQRVSGVDQAQAALVRLLRPDLRPRQSGRHYYIVTLEVETLSLSDLEELRRWLRGDVAPAIGGQANPTRAVERGLRRLMVRVIGLPTRRFESRTGTFVVE